MSKPAKNSITEYKYLPHGELIPKGWKLANDLQGTPHGHHAVLIVRKK